jgi:hypothetical protein
MYIPQKEKFNPSEVVLSCGAVKGELAHSIDEDHRRINIDSAKKRAVVQGMDYDGFRQMVLGAHLKPIKSEEVKELYDSKAKVIMNTVASAPTSEFVKQVQAAPPPKASVGSDLTEPANNFREFRKVFDGLVASKATPAAIISYLKLHPKEKINRVFTIDFNASYLVAILKTFIDFFSVPLPEPELTQAEILFALSFFSGTQMLFRAF